jgi:hypothetical protein
MGRNNKILVGKSEAKRILADILILKSILSKLNRRMRLLTTQKGLVYGVSKGKKLNVETAINKHVGM